MEHKTRPTDVESRLAALEAANARLRTTVRRLSLGLPIALATPLLFAFAPQAQDAEFRTITARSVVVKHGIGGAVQLALDENGHGRINTIDGMGQETILIGHDRSTGRPGIYFEGKEGRRLHIGVSANSDGSEEYAGMHLYTDKGLTTGGFTCNRKGEGTIWMEPVGRYPALTLMASQTSAGLRLLFPDANGSASFDIARAGASMRLYSKTADNESFVTLYSLGPVASLHLENMSHGVQTDLVARPGTSMLSVAEGKASGFVSAHRGAPEVSLELDGKLVAKLPAK